MATTKKKKATGGGGGGGSWNTAADASTNKDSQARGAAANKAKADLIDITDIVQGLAPNAKEIGKKLEEIFANVPSGTYNPALIDPRKIQGLYDSNPLITTAGLQQQLAAERASALEAQIAALDTRYKDSLGQVESAYGAVNQLLGSAQRDFTKGYNPIVASQAGVNAETAAAMKAAQDEVAARLASTGSTSVGGGQSAAVGNAVANEAAVSGAAQSDLLIGQGGAMQNYMTGMAPELAALARAGAIQGLGSARINAEAQARAAAAQAALEDRRALTLADIQARNQRGDSLISTMTSVMGSNNSAVNQARASNASAAQNLALAKAKFQADVLKEIQTRGMDFSADVYKTLGKLDQNVSNFVTESGGRGAGAIFNESRDGKALPKDAQLLNQDGTLNMRNFAKWSEATERDESYVMTYLAAARRKGLVNDNDVTNAINEAAMMRAVKDAQGSATDAKGTLARQNKLYDTYREDYTKKWGSYGMTEDPKVAEIMDLYLDQSMRSAFDPYYTPPVTQPSPGFFDRAMGAFRQAPGYVQTGVQAGVQAGLLATPGVGAGLSAMPGMGPLALGVRGADLVKGWLGK